MKSRIDLCGDWIQTVSENGIAFQFPAPEGAGRRPWGFDTVNDAAADVMGWYGLRLTLATASPETEVTVTARFSDSRPLTARLRFAQAGNHDCDVTWQDFDIERAKSNVWRNLVWIGIAGCSRLDRAEILRGSSIAVETEVLGKDGEAGEMVSYPVTVHSCLGSRQSVRATQVIRGWESMYADIVPERFTLEPYGSARVDIRVKMHREIPAGAHEKTTVRFVPEGNSAQAEEVSVTTLRRLAHPYLYHTREKWAEVARKIEEYPSFRPGYEKLLKDADSWTVPPLFPFGQQEYCCETGEEHYLMSCAYVYSITGREEYAQKIALFFRRFADRETGYPARKKGCSQSYVQEGHFFQHLALAYDMIYDSRALSSREREGMEACFRIYMDILDGHICDGHISNWYLSELTGAVYCAMVLQDYERMERFLFGSGGTFEQLMHGTFSDGWWHEGSVGYHTWVASMFLHTAHALLPFGINLLHTRFPLSYGKEVDSIYKGETRVIRHGMYNQKWGGIRKGSIGIKDLFDAVIPYLDDRGVMFGINDSDEKRIDGVHFGSTFDLAYTHYRDPAYLPVIRRQRSVDPIFGHPQLPETDRSLGTENAYSDNIGIAVLRSQTEGRKPLEQIQAVLRYGSHGFAHGHFDITELLSVMRYGRSIFNPENCWWGYAHFMYKFYVQCSLTKNMVVVDEKMQVPADSRRILWHSEQGLQAVGVAVTAQWAYPPYGGMVYEQDGQTNTKEELGKRCKQNGCWLPIVQGEGSPGYGELTGFTEPILQKRIMAVTDHYIVLFDYLEGQREHQYDSLMQLKGFLGLEGEDVAFTHHTEQRNPNPISDAQFITDCRWYQVRGGSVARFRTVFTQEHAGERRNCDRSNYNEPGILNMDVHTAWPRETRQMLGRVAVYDGWAADGDGYTIPLEYRLEVDGAVADSGAFDGWILGRGALDADVRGASQAALCLKQGVRFNELNDPVTTPQGVFWGEICLELADGRVVNLGKCLRESDNPCHSLVENCISLENVDAGCGIGKDYRGGRVTIVGTEYPDSLGASPIDHDREGRLVLNLQKLEQGFSAGVVRLTACVGVDAFPGDEWQKRKTYAVGTQGRVGRFLTVIEPYENDSVIDRVWADEPNHVCVTLKNGARQELTLMDVEKENPRILWRDSGTQKEQKGENT